jgi:hypothetical protein
MRSSDHYETTRGAVTGVTITSIVVPDPAPSAAPPVAQSSSTSQTLAASTSHADQVHASGDP